jgi:Rrf2 family protein
VNNLLEGAQNVNVAVADPGRGLRGRPGDVMVVTTVRAVGVGVGPREWALSATIGVVRVSAKADYAVRATVELAGAGATPLTAEVIASRQEIPMSFLQKILHELRVARLVASQRGPEGGHRLARPADEITVADILRAVEGPLAAVRGEAPEALHYQGMAEPLQDVWIALRTNMREVLEGVTLADLARARLPRRIATLAQRPESWITR